MSSFTIPYCFCAASCDKRYDTVCALLTRYLRDALPDELRQDGAEWLVQIALRYDNVTRPVVEMTFGSDGAEHREGNNWGYRRRVVVTDFSAARANGKPTGHNGYIEVLCESHPEGNMDEDIKFLLDGFIEAYETAFEQEAILITE